MDYKLETNIKKVNATTTRCLPDPEELPIDLIYLNANNKKFPSMPNP